MNPAAATKERPILFSGPMVRAILEGRKTQTRRVVKPQPRLQPMPCHYVPSGWAESDDIGCTCREVKCQFRKGMLLWVRESFWAHPANNAFYKGGSGRIHYDAALDDAKRKSLRAEGWKRKPPIHMPRWASRIALEITGVKVERLQDISEEDIYAEGIERHADAVSLLNEFNAAHALEAGIDLTPYPLAWFCESWSDINGKESWDANPWVWVISFKVSGAAAGE